MKGTLIMLKSKSRLINGGSLEDGSDSEINMAPLIDMIFILLIFFLVTASFVRQSGVEIQRPEAVTAQMTENAGLMIGMTSDGRIFADRNEVDLRSIRGIVEIFLIENPGGGVLIEADRQSSTGRLVEILDQCRLAGAEKIAVSARRPE